MESHFGHDFGHVRVHDDRAAAESARRVDALAYTVGNDVVFGAGLYSPDTTTGRRLLAHELTHVVQQSRGSRRVQSKDEPLRVSPPDDAFEAEADRAAEAVERATPAALSDPSTRAPPGLQRAPCPPAPTGLGDTPLAPADECPDATSSVTGHHISFCRDSDEMTSAGETLLRGLLPLLLFMPSIELHGFASPEGPRGRETAYNSNLSCRRARRVFNWLVSNGVPSSRLQVFKHGGGTELGPSFSANRAVVIPARPGPITPASTTTRFRVAALSFLACAGCNPFTDDGSLALSPPTAEPAVGTSYRMKHWIEAEIASSDGVHISPGSARVVSSGHSAGESGYCGTTSPAQVLSAVGPTSPSGLTDPVHGEGLEWESEFETRVGASVPCTLPDAPCGPLGTNPKIPPIRNRFRLRVFADGTKQSEFVSASTMPLHYLYDDGSLKMLGGSPVHPAVDFPAWATSTGASMREAETGLKALRIACCQGARGGVPGCACTCSGGLSTVPSGPFINSGDLLLACLGAGAAIFAGSCPTACAPAGAVCSLTTMRSNP